METYKLGVVAHTCSPSTWEAEVGGLHVQGQTGLPSEFAANLSFTV